MALYNAATKELTAKIVYYGPGLGGKTTNLQLLHDRLEPGTAGKLLTLSTQTDRTIFFDLLPVDLGEIRGYRIRFQLATVPGHSSFNESRKITLRGADGIVFVADSRWAMLPENQESWQNLKDNLREVGLSFETIPIVVQYNKRDLPEILSIGAMQEALGLASYPFAEAVASAGRGVTETFKLISKLTFMDLLRRLQGPEPEEEEAAASDRRAMLLVSPPGSAPEPAPGFGASEAPEPARADELERLAAAEARIAAIEERLESDAEERRRLAESAAETAARLSAAENRLDEHEADSRSARQAAEAALASEAEDRWKLAESASETAARLAAAESRLEEQEAARRTARQASEDALATLSARAEKLSEEVARLARQVEALETGLQESAGQDRREAEDIRSQIAPLLEAHEKTRASDRQALGELDRLREALSDSLAEISDRLRRAVREP